MYFILEFFCICFFNFKLLNETLHFCRVSCDVCWGSFCWGDGVWGLLPSGCDPAPEAGAVAFSARGVMTSVCPMALRSSCVRWVHILPLSSQGVVLLGQQAPVSTQAYQLSPPERLLEAKEATCHFSEVLQAQRSLWDVHAEAEAAVVPTRPLASAAKRFGVFKACASRLGQAPK